MTTMLATIFVFGLIVLIHELGHFITAKLCGMRVEEFAIGFGPSILSVQKGETLYSIRLIPLGGFNKISGMDPDEELDERSYQSKPVWQRMIVISAGAIMNFVLAIVLFFLIFVGTGLSIPTSEAIIGNMTDRGPAMTAGVHEGDRVLSINGKAVQKWTDINKNFKGLENQVVTLVVEREGKEEKLSIIPIKSDDRAIIGVYPQMTSKYFSPSEGATMAVANTGEIISAMFSGVWSMVTGEERAAVSGPIGVAQLAGQFASLGFSSLLHFTAMLSINLGVLNLLPVPMLDGGHLVVLFFEAILGRRIPSKVLYYVQMVGFALLVSLFIYATSNDIRNLIGV